MAKKKKGATSAAAVSVARCLNEAQRSISVHRKLVRTLCARLVEDGAVCILKELAPCLAHLLLVFSRDTHVERVVRFVIQFVTHPVDGGEDEETRKLLEEQESLIEALLSWLLTMTKACEKSVRYRSCQLIAGILTRVPAHVSLPSALLDELRAQILCRLKDKVPQVRAQAARALARFQECGDDGEFSDDAITAAYQQMVGGDRNKEVRKVVLASIAVSTHTLRSILMHTRDTCDSVRRTAYLVLASKVPMSALTIKQRNDALRRGLGDRMPAVKEAALVMLKQWYRETQDQVKAANGAPDVEPKDSDTLMCMIDSLDVEAYENECEIAVRELLARKILNAVALVKELDASDAYTLRRGTSVGSGEDCLSSACALVWRVLCATINREAKDQGQAAAMTSGTESAVHASQVTHKLDTLEEVLPASSEDFVNLIDFHIQSKFGVRFVVKQLLLVACECVEFADATSSALGEVVFKTLASERAKENLFSSKVVEDAEEEDFDCGLFCQGSNGKWEAALMKFGAKVFGSSKSCMKQLTFLVMSKLGASSAHADAEDLVQGCMLLNACFESCTTFACLDLDAIPQIAAHVSETWLTHESVAVRREAIKLCGMLMLHSNCSNEGLLSVFSAALKSDHYQVKTESAKFFLDLAHLNGPKYAAHQFKRVMSSCPIELLRQCLDAGADTRDGGVMAQDGDQEDKKEFRKVVVEGFLKLLANHGKYRAEYAWTAGEECDVLTSLVFLNFDKECGSHPPTQQCISLFFDVYSMLHEHTYQIVGASVLPVIKEALRREIKPRVFGQLVRFLTHLIQRSPGHLTTQSGGAEVVETQQKVATSLICEMQFLANQDNTLWEEEEEKTRAAVPHLLKVLLKLRAQDFDPSAVSIMRALLSGLSEANATVFGTKDFASVTAMFAGAENDGLGEVSPDLQSRADAVYEQYLSMKTPSTVAGEGAAAEEEEEEVEKEKENEEEEEVAETKTKERVAEPQSPVRRVLRSRNVVS